MIRFSAIIGFSSFAILSAATSKEKEAPEPPSEIKKESATVRLLADHDQVAPGSTFTAGLLIKHGLGFHTYWRLPGIVGMPTAIEWQLPEGVSAGPIEWPGPELTKMANLTVWGYERDIVLMTEIRIASSFPDTVLPIKAKVRWMACAKSCHPTWADLALEIPIGTARLASKNAELIRRSRAEVPAKLPGNWSFSATKHTINGGYRVEGVLAGPQIIDAESLVFFCDDNQVHSDHPQKISLGKEGIRFQLPSFDLAPKNPMVLSGVIYNPKGWHGLNNRWLRVGAPHPSTQKDPPQAATD